MYAIVEIGNQQYKVSKDDVIVAHKIDGDVGTSVELDRVLMTVDENKINVGNPVIEGAQVKAKIVDFTRGKTVIVFKKKRRKGYKVKNGHRQKYTQLKIEEIIAN